MVFFVKDFAGDPKRHETRGFERATTNLSRGKKIATRFKDGELVFGYAQTYMPDRSGFFITAADPASNNLRFSLLIHAMREVKADPGRGLEGGLSFPSAHADARTEHRAGVSISGGAAS